MPELKSHTKVLSALNLAASDTREDTFESIISNTLYEKGNIKRDVLASSIQELYEFEPYKTELDSTVQKMNQADKILFESDQLVLSDLEKERLRNLEMQVKDIEKSRFQNFKHFILEDLNEVVDISDIQLLWNSFSEYLYQCFYDYGEKAAKRIYPEVAPTNGLESDAFLKICKKITDPIIAELFRKVVERFPDYATQNDIDFLNELAQRTLSFTSLGYEPDLAEPGIQHDLIDWTLYLDTNVLFSILDLHFHPENEACKALIKLINENKNFFNIKLRYSELTAKELISKKEDFSLIDDKLSDSAIRALLRTSHIDDFSKQYYEKLLEDRDSALHPSEVLDLSNRTLKVDSIEISRNAARVEQIGESFLDTRIKAYYEFISDKNRLKEEFCINNGIKFHPYERSEKQVIHDITLRELLIHLRSSRNKSDEMSLNTVKYFSLTLDDLLISYDRYETNKNFSDHQFPVFFKPSYLLNKLVKVLPIKTNDYRKAFLKAVTSRGFNRDIQKTHDVLKIINYLKSKGITDENVIYNIISDDLILDRYKKNSSNPDFNSDEYIDSELNKLFKKKERDLSEALEALEKSRSEIKAKEESIIEKEKSLKLNQVQQESLINEIRLYKSAIEQLTKDVNQLRNHSDGSSQQPKLDFDRAANQDEIIKLKEKLKHDIEEKITSHKERVFREWQRLIWWGLFLVVPVTFIVTDLILTQKLFITDNNALKFITGVFTLGIDGVFITLIKLRYWDEKNKEVRYNKIPVPRNLSAELESLDSKD